MNKSHSIHLKFIDSTLRDGLHVFKTNPEFSKIKRICSQLDKTGLYAIDVGFGLGIGDSETLPLIKSVRKDIKITKMAALVTPGLTTEENLNEAATYGLDITRIAVIASCANRSVPFIKLSKKLKMETGVFLMVSNLSSPDEMASQAKIIENAGADFIYIGDSIGAMTPEDISQRVDAIMGSVKIPIGIHTHNSLGLGVSNAIAGIKAGCTMIDGTLEGLGAGGGNGNLQAIIAVCEKSGINTEIDFRKLNTIVNNSVRPIMENPQELLGQDIELGFNGEFPSMLKRFQ